MIEMDATSDERSFSKCNIDGDYKNRNDMDETSDSNSNSNRNESLTGVVEKDTRSKRIRSTRKLKNLDLEKKNHHLTIEIRPRPFSMK